MLTLHIRQDTPKDGHYPVRLTLKQRGQPDRTAEAGIEFALTEQEQEEIRWYLEDYLQHADIVEAVTVEQIEERMKARGIELYTKVLAFNGDTQAIWFAIRDRLADLRVEITTGVAEAASIPWELMRDPKLDSPVSLRVSAFVRVQSNPGISFVTVPKAKDGRIRLLYIVCRPSGSKDVELRAVANRLLQDLGPDRARFDIKTLRPPTFEQLQKELADAKKAKRPYHIVHFDGHGTYEDLSETTLANWVSKFTPLMLGGGKSGPRGYILFEHPGDDKMRPVDGQELGQLLHDNGVPVLVLNACQSAMHEATAAPKTAGDVHDEVRAIGSLAQAVVDQGIPAVLGMRYSVYVVTAAQYIGQLYAELAKGSSFGEAAGNGRKHLRLNPDRWVGLQSRPLQDWFVPVVYEAMPVELSAAGPAEPAPELDPVQGNTALLRHVPEEGFIGRDETLLALDRAFDTHRVVLLHAYAGQGKSSAAVEFARWYSVTGGLGAEPHVLFASFESHTDLADLLNQIGQPFASQLKKPVDWTAENDPAKRREIVKRILRQIPVLWIWDNVEPVAGFPEGTESQWTAAEQGELHDFLHQIKLDNASRVKILLTSRRDEANWLGKIPHRIAMPRMTNSDAAKLALKLGEEKGLKRSEISNWQPLLDYCAGNPLTLRVLAGQAIKAGLRQREHIEAFVEAIRAGEQKIEDADEKQGRDKSLGASLDYGFKHAFKDDELPIIALLHLFQGTVDVDVLEQMGKVGKHALPELKGATKEHLTALLERATDTGLLTHLAATWFTIHPALPWFLRQLFARHYDGQSGRSASQAALRAWVEAVGVLSNHYHRQFNQGNRQVIRFLELEEANFLQARRLARRNQWWSLVISCMQGLRNLYEYQGRIAEWAGLVEEIRPDYCTDDDEPIPSLEDQYSLLMDYRVHLARNYEQDLPKAAVIQEKAAEVDRRQAASILALPANAPLDDHQRHLLRTLGVSEFSLGQILREQQDPACLKPFQESLTINRRIGDKPAESISEFNLGHAYYVVPAIRNLDAAEAAYQRSLDLRNPNDATGRAGCIKQIGMVHHERFRESRRHKEPMEILKSHFQAAESHYLGGLQLCPKDALNSFAALHNGLGNLYAEVGQLDKAREHYEQDAQYEEKVGNHFGAGQTRRNMALMYAQASRRETQPSQQRDSLLRAQAYAKAALRDFKHYQGRAAKDEAETQHLLDLIAQVLAKLPPEAS
ncbi:CHAT domain-containing protein [Zavarzinella formosa]|uniref:CHAT domain-containing protein n=1 Tax=Zavarzinella formosa TaxID=360055 RepID=UPI0002ED2C93|nr:CHAT domain-containing protein [Zavarzinella formosa]